MSIVSLLIGQCGIQVGFEFFKTIANDINFEKESGVPSVRDSFDAVSMDTFFSSGIDGRQPEARCVQVDMEEKVIRNVTSDAHRHCNWNYSSNSFCAKRGSGNNWVMGYLLNGPSCMETVGDMLTKELEKCDSVDGLITTMSLAGGTGSGVGTFLLRNLNDICPKVPVLSQLIWPYERGEVATQSYNAVLSLAHLLDTSVGGLGFIFYENDRLHRACLHRCLPSTKTLQQVPLVELNRLMTHLLGGLLQPYSESRGGRLCRRRLSRLLFELSGPTDFNLYRLHCLPYHLDLESRRFSTETWPQLLRHGRQQLLTGACLEDSLNWSVSPSSPNRQPLLACSGVARGDGVGDFDWSDLCRDLFISPSLQPWRSDPNESRISTTPRHFNGHPRGLFLASSGGGLVSEGCGSSDVCAPLRRVRTRAAQLLRASAYLHQFEQFGMEDPRGSLMEALAVVEQVIQNYASLTLQ